jgi:N-acyl-D-amino-acid deacylase
MPNRFWKLILAATLLAFVAITNSAAQQSNGGPLAATIHRITSRREFRHADFGVEFYSLDTNQRVFSLQRNKLFTPASTTKLLTEGSALELLGPDYRFHTRVYRTGPLDAKGELHGDLVLVASGDPNISGRIQPDGTLAFENTDHCYGGSFDTRAVPGDPLLVLRELARQVAAHGVKRIDGRVLVDVSLFPEGEHELGTGTVISPIIVNDNIVDVTVTPGNAPNSPVSLKVSPDTPYVHFINMATTGPANSDPNVNWATDTTNPDGTHTVTVAGTTPIGKPSVLFDYPVPQPSRFAQMALVEALREDGVTIGAIPGNDVADFKAVAASYTAPDILAEHTSPPLSEEVKVTLKVSQNLHASVMPYILGAVLGGDHVTSVQTGFDLERKFLLRAGLDLSGASQGDGAGGAQSAFFTPDFMVHYLAFMHGRKYFPVLFNALPILGRDGTLFDVQTASRAAGHVHAKTGTFDAVDLLNRDDMVTGKGLAGYLTTADGRHLAFAIYANRVAVPLTDDWVTKIVGQAVGEIAAAGYGAPAQPAQEYDVLIKNGHIIDGTGSPWYAGDVGIRGDRIVAIGKLTGATAGRVIDATGLVVSPGFIDMLGQSEFSLLIDNRSLSKLSQGITSEITGEGGSIAPQDDLTLAPLKPFLDHYHLTVDWTTLSGYFNRLEREGTPINIGTYVGAAQVREAVIGDADRAPRPDELKRMEDLVARAMQQGALGISTALIYPPGHYAKTDELIALAKVASRYGGIYATHMRSEGASENAAVDEAFRIGREADIPVEIFHLKVSGKSRWGGMPKLVAKIQAARNSGLDVTADMYPYLAGATALASSLPPWVADGGPAKLLSRLHDPAVRRRIRQEMAADHPGWENLYFDSGGASGVMISSVMNPALKKFEGKTVAQVAQIEHKDPLTALFDFVIADNAQTGALYFIANEKDLEYGLKQPWTSIGLDDNESSMDGPLYLPHDHPRGWGSMPRLLGYYVRQKHLMALQYAIRKITSMPANREHLEARGLLKPGYFADVTVFDPATIKDTSTYLHPVSLPVGVDYVFVNGQLEYDHGKLTGATAGRPLRGQWWQTHQDQANHGKTDSGEPN